jgi:hypothetical protein
MRESIIPPGYLSVFREILVFVEFIQEPRVHCCGEMP